MRSARNIDHGIDHGILEHTQPCMHAPAVYRCGSGVGGSEQGEPEQNDVEVIAPWVATESGRISPDAIRMVSRAHSRAQAT